MRYRKKFNLIFIYLLFDKNLKKRNYQSIITDKLYLISHHEIQLHSGKVKLFLSVFLYKKIYFTFFILIIFCQLFRVKKHFF